MVHGARAGQSTEGAHMQGLELDAVHSWPPGFKIRLMQAARQPACNDMCMRQDVAADSTVYQVE